MQQLSVHRDGPEDEEIGRTGHAHLHSFDLVEYRLADRELAREGASATAIAMALVLQRVLRLRS